MNKIMSYPYTPGEDAVFGINTEYFPHCLITVSAQTDLVKVELLQANKKTTFDPFTMLKEEKLAALNPAEKALLPKEPDVVYSTYRPLVCTNTDPWTVVGIVRRMEMPMTTRRDAIFLMDKLQNDLLVIPFPDYLPPLPGQDGSVCLTSNFLVYDGRCLDTFYRFVWFNFQDSQVSTYELVPGETFHIKGAERRYLVTEHQHPLDSKICIWHNHFDFPVFEYPLSSRPEQIAVKFDFPFLPSQMAGMEDMALWDKVRITLNIDGKKVIWDSEQETAM